MELYRGGSIGEAIEWCWEGMWVRRAEWEPTKCMHIILPKRQARLKRAYIEIYDGIMFGPYTAGNWDLLAEDWEVCDPPNIEG